jgi:phosphoribosylglycinamide formyltransferase 1
VRSRIAVLASGGGTNLQAILDHLDQLGDARPAEVVCVASDRAAAGALTRAVSHGIAAEVLRSSGASGGDELSDVLAAHRVDLIVLAGYLRLVPVHVVQQFTGRILNVHPALLPAFGGPGMYGNRVHQAVLDSGATVTGVTVHLVSDEYDRGRILAQWPVPVLRGDDVATLAARVLRIEHLLLPRVVAAYAAARADVSTPVGAVAQPSLAFTLLERDDHAIAGELTRLVRGQQTPYA